MKPGTLHKNVEERLRAEKPLHTVSPGFAERVIDALPAKRMTFAPARTASGGIWPRLALAGLLGTVALTGWLRFSPQTPKSAEILLTETPPKPGGTIIGLPPVTMEQVQALTVKIDEPLEKELQLVLSDTKNAIRFVASNFMPEN